MHLFIEVAALETMTKNDNLSYVKPLTLNCHSLKNLPALSAQHIKADGGDENRALDDVLFIILHA